MLGASEKFRIPKMTVKDNMEAYLKAFEQTAIMAGWDRGKWALLLDSLLIGPTQAAY